jgi:FkbH-like protein
MDAPGLLDELRRAVDGRRTPAAPVRRSLAALDDPVLARTAGRILARLEPDDGQLVPVRLAVLATCTVGPFEHLLRAGLVGVGVLPALEPAGYGSFDLTLSSGAFSGGDDPDVVACLVDGSRFLPGDWHGADVEALAKHVAARAEEFRSLIVSATGRTSSTLVLHTVPLPGEVRDTLVSWRARAALTSTWYRLNTDILTLAEEHRQIVVVDLVGLLADVAQRGHDPRLHRYADMPYTDGALLALARQVTRVVQARTGRSRKVLALDLDNTLWGGVLGEVGEHAVELGGLYPGRCYLDLQRTVRRLREQGVLLVLASKNDAEIVDRAMTRHPEMLLRPDAFAVTAVNWSPKAGNLATAAESLSLSPQAFVFMDDSAHERGYVGDELPDVALVAADGDPADLVESLLRGGWFDTMDLTDADRARPELYRSRSLRSEFAEDFGSSQDYLRALGIELVAAPVTAFEIARVAQLAARTNQFNLTGARFDETATAAMSADPDHLVVSMAVSDRFGDEGIVGALWVRRGSPTWRVLNMVLSCRVLGRGIELAGLAWLCRRAADAGATTIEGRFVPSGRNAVAADVWERAGFAPGEAEGTFLLDLAGAQITAPDWVTTVTGSEEEPPR